MEASQWTALSLLLLAAVRGNEGGYLFYSSALWGVSMDEETVKTPIP